MFKGKAAVGLHGKVQRRAFQHQLDETTREGRRVLIVIDEAQNLQPEVLEELRMLSNINSDKDQLLQLVLGIADGRMEVDGREIYTANDLRVGLFTSTEGF